MKEKKVKNKHRGKKRIDKYTVELQDKRKMKVKEKRSREGRQK